MARYLTGTIAQLAGKLTLNGVTLGQPELSVLTRVTGGALFRQVGIIRNEGARGRPSIVWQVDTESALFLECGNAEGLAESDDASPDYVKEVKAA